MIQLYLLTVLTTLFTGLTLSKEFLAKRSEWFSDNTGFMDNGVYKIILGSLTAVIGVLNLFLTLPPRNVPVLGDLFPSLLGMVSGTLLVIGYVNSRQSAESTTEESEDTLTRKVEVFSAPYFAVLGIITIIIGILHAIAGTLLLL